MTGENILLVLALLFLAWQCGVLMGEAGARRPWSDECDDVVEQSLIAVHRINREAWAARGALWEFLSATAPLAEAEDEPCDDDMLPILPTFGGSDWDFSGNDVGVSVNEQAVEDPYDLD